MLPVPGAQRALPAASVQPQQLLPLVLALVPALALLPVQRLVQQVQEPLQLVQQRQAPLQQRAAAWQRRRALALVLAQQAATTGTA